MKKIIVGIIITALLMALSGCGSEQSKESTTKATTTAAANTVTSTTTAGDKELSGTITTNGSTSMEKVIAILIEAFTAKHPDVTMTYDATGSSSGVTSAQEGSADIGMASRNLKDSETGVTATVVAIDGIAIIVNNKNSVQDLTLDQLAKLAKGEFKSWSEVGGEDAPVVVVGREAGSGTRDGFESIVKVKDACAYDQELTSTGAVVAAVQSNENAIGYASLSSVKDTVKLLTIEGVKPTEQTVRDGSYKVQRNFNFITKDGVENSVVDAFIEFALSTEATDLITRAGAVQATK